MAEPTAEQPTETVGSELVAEEQPAVAAAAEEEAPALVTNDAHKKPQEDSSAATETTADDKKKLEELTTAANLQYSLKNYSAAADIYSSATELQASINGDLDPRNAELLFQYGRCLYYVAIQNADVLGGKVAGEKKKQKQQNGKDTNGASSKKSVDEAAAAGGSGLVDLADVAAVSVAREAAEEKAQKDKGEAPGQSNPFFSFTGDETWSDDDDEEVEGEEGGEGEEEEDDFTTAYDILEVARVLLTKQIEADQPSEGDASEKGKGKAAATGAELSPELKHLKERLADTRGLQAEICLEHERFDDAVTDARAALELCQELFGEESSLIAEAHYKLSLALEFASALAPEGSEDAGAAPTIDTAMREEAAREMEAAISSCKKRIENEQKTADNLEEGDAKKKALKNITEVKGLLKELEDRVSRILHRYWDTS